MVPRLYEDLSWLWPYWGDPSNYAPFCQNVTRLIRKHARREVKNLLNIACGGGKNIYNLKQDFSVTGLDLSPSMLQLARELNPECRFNQADMRCFSLDEKFDAILVDDGICYMTSESDLGSVFERCFSHLHPGGVMFVGPDETRETFIQNKSAVTNSDSRFKPDHLDLVFVENDFDPDPLDDHYESLILYIIRENGILRVEEDLHILGLFSMDTWRRLLRVPGFEVVEESYNESGREYLEFVCIKPG